MLLNVKNLEKSKKVNIDCIYLLETHFYLRKYCVKYSKKKMQMHSNPSLINYLKKKKTNKNPKLIKNK